MNSVVFVIIVLAWSAFALRQLLNLEEKEIPKYIGILMISNIVLTLLASHFK